MIGKTTVLLFICSMVLVTFALSALAQTESDFDRHMRVGKQYVDDKEYDKALQEFRDAFRAKPSSKGAVFNIAYCLLRLNRLEAALNKFEAYIGMNPAKEKSQKARIFVEQISMELSKTRALVTITTEPSGASVYLDGHPAGDFPKTPASFWATYGRHKLVLKLAGYVTRSKTISLKKGSKVTENFALVKEEKRIVIQDKPVEKKPSYAGPWVTFGVGTATAAAGLVVYLLALQDFRDADEFYDSPEKETEYTTMYNDARNKAIAGDLLMIAGGAAAVGGIIWRIAAGTKARQGAKKSAFGICPTEDGLFGSFALTF